ncbi:lipoprotein [Bacteroidia bacterium]|nr:lipoprotein [Bacteroidia bacterium]
MKTKKLLLIVVSVVVSCHLFAENYPTGSLLWKISGKNLAKPSYILGTFHLKPGAYLDSIPGARTAFESSEQIVGEIILDNTQQMQIMSKAMMPADTTYHSLYSDEDYDYVNKQLTPLLGAGLDQLGQLKPSLIQTLVVVLNLTKKMPGFNSEDQIDTYVQKEAIKKQKPVVGLETIEYQIYTLFNSSSLQRQADILLCSLKNIDLIMSKEIDLLLSSYEKADLNALNDLFVTSEDELCPSTPEEINLLIKDRNDNWLQKLPAIMLEKSSFIAVGAGHLVGKDGLLYQLQQAGYKIEAVK